MGITGVIPLGSNILSCPPGGIGADNCKFTYVLVAELI
jgi:hypothetical protein